MHCRPLANEQQNQCKLYESQLGVCSCRCVLLIPKPKHIFASKIAEELWLSTRFNPFISLYQLKNCVVLQLFCHSFVSLFGSTGMISTIDSVCFSQTGRRHDASAIQKVAAIFAKGSRVGINQDQSRFNPSASQLQMNNIVVRGKFNYIFTLFVLFNIFWIQSWRFR